MATATHTEEGTGKHRHKSSEEPFAHHEAPTQKGESGSESGEGSHRGSSHEGSRAGSHESRGEGSQGESGRESKGSGSEGGDDLKAREYTGPDGEVHHHTKTYMEQHKGK